MANAVRSVSIWKGLDPRDLTLVAFGGAGGMVAGEVARTLGIPRVLIPPVPGQHVRDGAPDDRLPGGRVGRVPGARERGGPRRLNERLGDAAGTTSSDARAPGRRRGRRWPSHIADIRYHGQIHELQRPVRELPGHAGGARASDRALRGDLRGHLHDPPAGRVPEMVSLRVIASGGMPQYEPASSPTAGSAEPTGRATVLEGDEWRAVDVYRRYDLPRRDVAAGPVILEEEGSTIWVASGMSATSNAGQPADHDRRSAGRPRPAGSPRRWPDMATVEKPATRASTRSRSR